MIAILLDFFKKHQINTDKIRILLACSGGMDSMCLAHLLIKSEITFALAHIDHSTREGDSYRDRLFVEQFAENHQLNFFVNTIDIEAEKQHTKESFQMIARRLRYDFLRKIAEEHQFDFIATAHHQDDNVETFLINLSRAQGVSGLSGIAEMNDLLIRPLLCVDREAIRTFVYNNKIEFCEDVTNFTTKYQRNTWRRTLLPYIHRHYPSFSRNIAKSIDYLAQADEFIDTTIQLWKAKYVTFTKAGFKVPIEGLKQYHDPSFLLLKILQPLGFNHTHVTDALSFQHVGKSCESEGYVLRLERDFFILEKKEQPSNYSPISVFDGLEIPDLGILRIKKHISNQKEGIILPKDWCEYLSIRHWKPGDRFKPIGMNGKSKKLKKYFVDEKYSTSEKDNQWLLTYKNQVIWVIGRRKSIVPESEESVMIVFEK